MKTFKVTACYYTFCTATVEAESEEQAYELAREMDGGDFADSRSCHDWHINDIQEMETEV
jgi:hypothetical protein